jgi:hypothetical protein
MNGTTVIGKAWLLVAVGLLAQVASAEMMPKVQRFAQRDPLSEQQPATMLRMRILGSNRYSYCHCRPLRDRDSSGQCTRGASRVTTTYGKQCGILTHKLCATCSYCPCGAGFPHATGWQSYGEVCGTCTWWYCAPPPPGPCAPPTLPPFACCAMLEAIRSGGSLDGQWCQDCCLTLPGAGVPYWQEFVQACADHCPPP